MKALLAYAAVGSLVAGWYAMLRHLGGLRRMPWDAVVATIILWPIAIANRIMARRGDPLQQFELMVLEQAHEHRTSISEQRRRLGEFAPPHEFSPDRTPELLCSVCKRGPGEH